METECKALEGSSGATVVSGQPHLQCSSLDGHPPPRKTRPGAWGPWGCLGGRARATNGRAE
eukprot:1024721-Pyramimonas_sp.AAC.3